MIYYQHMKSPVGKLLVAGNNKGLHLISFPKGNKPSFPEPVGWKTKNPFKRFCANLKPILLEN